MKRAKTKTIYYNEHGKIDKLTTYINKNNNTWIAPAVFIICLIIGGIIEAL